MHVSLHVPVLCCHFFLLWTLPHFELCCNRSSLLPLIHQVLSPALSNSSWSPHLLPSQRLPPFFMFWPSSFDYCETPFLTSFSLWESFLICLLRFPNDKLAHLNVHLKILQCLFITYCIKWTLWSALSENPGVHSFPWDDSQAGLKVPPYSLTACAWP